MADRESVAQRYGAFDDGTRLQELHVPRESVASPPASDLAAAPRGPFGPDPHAPIPMKFPERRFGTRSGLPRRPTIILAGGSSGAGRNRAACCEDQKAIN